MRIQENSNRLKGRVREWRPRDAKTEGRYRKGKIEARYKSLNQKQLGKDREKGKEKKNDKRKRKRKRG